ncbi:hypothetical protein D1869_05700 [Sulfurisphaera ohwakuensis]|uniref:Uncharacterized protein n=2 Tax=Sulfurisphaera ohwakuensis TaxID=69656 RepID=A0A650CG52_SULOH|nr:hypothetical protein [Sulfurisphaera ohwakuensis]MBB5254457.1 hypothetical protein [Sulfurisphaera ohwakuensis]QGR16736.1 hypothetical protein D1869_05700 [Sulfurisphaera ohwakuensis]
MIDYIFDLLYDITIKLKSLSIKYEDMKISHKVTKLIIVLTMMKFLVIFPPYFISGSDTLYLLTSKWDSTLFETIAKYGYIKPYLFAFPPIYPFLIHLVHFIFGSYYISALIVTNIFGYLFPIIVYKVFGYKTALLLELFPVYIIYSTLPYSDVIYLTAVGLVFYFLKKGKILPASIAMGFAITNFYSIAFTLPSFAVKLKQLFLKFIIIPLVSGFVILIWYYLSTGNPFYYFELERNIWGVKFVTPLAQVNWIMNGWFTTQHWTILSFELKPIDWLIRNLSFEIFFIILTIMLLRLKDKDKLFYLIYSLSVMIPLFFIIGTPAISIPRLLLAAFPSFHSLKIDRTWLLIYVITSATLTPLFTFWQIYAFFS